ncbi:MAG: signal peptidase I [Clostridiaceae bacterium]|nr:signal peptidase I [Clostridiaceae bacterium]
MSKKSNFFSEWVVPVLVALVAAILIRTFLLFQAEIPSTSMVPTLNVNDKIWVTKVYNTDSIERGDIVVFDSDELKDTLIKRVIGLPGDDIKIVDGVVSVNGEEINEDYVVNKDNWNGEYHVPEGKFFFCGDNRPASFDSRRWQNPFIDKDKIVGKARLRVYPFSNFGFLK